MVGDGGPRHPGNGARHSRVGCWNTGRSLAVVPLSAPSVPPHTGSGTNIPPPKNSHPVREPLHRDASPPGNQTRTTSRCP